MRRRDCCAGIRPVRGRLRDAARRRPCAHRQRSWSSTPRTAASTTSTACSPAPRASRRRPPEQKTQLDHDGRPLPHLPPAYEHGKPDPHNPAVAGLPNGPFRIDLPPINRRMDEVLPSPWHLYYQNREQINGGRNNMFVAMANVGGWVMGYFDGSKMKMWKWAREYTLADHFFMGAFGGSYLNHQWLVCACTPMDPNAPAGRARAARRRRQAEEEAGLADIGDAGAGGGVRRARLARRLSRQHLAAALPAERHPARAERQPRARRFDALSRAAVPREDHRRHAVGEGRCPGPGTRAAGTPRSPTAGSAPGEKRTVIYRRDKGSPIFQPHHQPFNYYARFAPGTADRARAPEGRDGPASQAIDKGTLPQVAFFKPAGPLHRAPELHRRGERRRAHRGRCSSACRRARSGRRWP